MAETIAQVVMFGLDIEGLIALDVTLTRLRTGCMSLAVVDVQVVLVIAVVILHTILPVKLDVRVVKVRRNIILNVMDLNGEMVESTAVIHIHGREK